MFRSGLHYAEIKAFRQQPDTAPEAVVDALLVEVQSESGHVKAMSFAGGEALRVEARRLR
jgi:hypothetical protein